MKRKGSHFKSSAKSFQKESVMASPNVSQPTFLRIGTSGTITGMHSKLKLAVFKTSLSVPVGAMIATIPKTASDSRMARAATRWFHFAVAFGRDHLLYLGYAILLPSPARAA